MDWEDPLEEEMATHSSILEEPGGLQSMGSQRDTTEATQHTCMQRDWDSNLAVSDPTVMFSFVLKDPRKNQL